MADDATAPDNPSSDYQAMCAFWEMVATLDAGADAVIAAGQTYLPKFPHEDKDDYAYRLQNAKFTGIYTDIIDNLASKPFAEDVTLKEGAADVFAQFAEDIDGRGNNLHVFAYEVFRGGINNAIDWIVVDFTTARQRADGQPLSLADEKAQGLRPYWVRVPARAMLAVYSDTVGGKEIFTHARWRETISRREGFCEVCIERVRVMNREPVFLALEDGTVTDQVIGYDPPTYEVWEQSTEEQVKNGEGAWRVVERGDVTVGEIPIRPFITGRRIGNGWRFIAPMKGVAFLQKEHYQQETALKSIKELTAYPMLAANGVELPKDAAGNPKKVPMGPKSVVSAPPIMGDTSATHGEWKWIEPTAENVKFLAADVERTEAQMRELGRQPLTQSAGITVVAAAIASQKAASTAQAWALALKNTLEECFQLTAKWLGQVDGPEVKVFTDFALAPSDQTGPTWIQDMAKRERLSAETEWEEAQRRGVLSGDFDPTTELTRIAKAKDDAAKRAAEAAKNAPPGATAPPAPGTKPSDPAPPPTGQAA